MSSDILHLAGGRAATTHTGPRQMGGLLTASAVFAYSLHFLLIYSMQRVQRKREKGWKMPPNTVSVCRPTKWGNPFKLVGDQIFLLVGRRWVWYNMGDEVDVLYLYDRILDGIDWQNPDLQFWSDHFKRVDLSELKGKNLACFCPPEKKCHADILIRRVLSIPD